MDIKTELTEFGLALDGYGILRKPNGRPSCPNELLEKVVRKKMSDGLTPAEENLYGYLVMTLARIVLNNKVMKHQEESLRMECFSEMMTVINDVERNFDWGHGSKYYSYLFNAMYHAGIRVLVQKNRRLAVAANFMKEEAEKYLYCGCRVGPVGSQTAEGEARRYFIEEIEDDGDC